MNSPSEIPSNVVPIDADEQIYRNLSKNDRYGAALPLSFAERNRFIENVLAAADDVTFVNVPSSRRRSVLPLIAAAALLLIIGAGIGVFVFSPNVPIDPKGGTVQLSSSTASSPAPENRTVPADLSPPPTLAAEVFEGPGVFSPSKGIDLSLLADSNAEVLHPSASATEIRLFRGALWAAVNPDVPHDLLTVVTEDGRVEVKGTVFYVSKDIKRSEVQVLRGLVQVTDREGRRTSLTAGHKKDIGAEQDSPLEPKDIENGWVAVEAAALAVRPDKDDTVRAVVDHKREHIEKAPPPEAALLGEIRQNRLSGDWQEVATLYETLIRTHKGSPSARAALISLGELRLKKLHAPDAALSLFTQYLSLNEPTLAREALLGKADALKALGRKATEAEVLSEFLRRYPDAVQADPIRRRLEELKSTQK